MLYRLFIFFHIFIYIKFYKIFLEIMSKRKTVRVTESELVDLIDKIVNETVGEKKKRWIAEQRKAKKSLLETRLAKVESKLRRLK